MNIAIVTGGSSGIGASTAVELARRGTGVILTYNSNKKGAQDTVAAIEGAGGTAVALPLDIGATEDFPAFGETVAATLRGQWQRDTFSFLVNNAGIGHGAVPFAQTTPEIFDRLTRVLLRGPFFLTQELLPRLADGGAIVNVASGSARPTSVEAGYSAYAALKGGLIVLTRNLAKELAGRGIRVNSVAPGATRTAIADNSFERYPEAVTAMAARAALGRIGEPDDIGRAIAMLLSGDAGWITAQDIEVSGGFNL
jgi:NAD(P)-dependent dehydrogenase (short-subunit alcohol dehydrogenase family)